MLRVFEISRMTNHNGPGIRTLVHFKGCPLRCIWCSTPESQSREEELGVKRARCIGCGECMQVCPQGAISPSEVPGGGMVVDRGLCVSCFSCVDVCYAHSMTRIGSIWSVKKLVKEIEKDELFFRNSGGGVTFSGGEPLMFVDDEYVSLYSELYNDGISIGVDTTGCVRWENIERVLPYVDFFLWDLKLMDSARHKELVGVGNELVLDNLRRVEANSERYDTKVYIRCVQVPGMTDTDDNLRRTCEFISGMKCIKELDLVNFHHFGKKRYEYIGRPYQLDGLEPLSKETLERKRKIVEEYGVVCKTSM